MFLARAFLVFLHHHTSTELSQILKTYLFISLWRRCIMGC